MELTDILEDEETSVGGLTEGSKDDLEKVKKAINDNKGAMMGLADHLKKQGFKKVDTVIIDMIPNDERTGPPYQLFFALNMLVHTEDGSTYTLNEYRDWLSASGFHDISTAEIGIHSPVILATKRE